MFNYKSESICSLAVSARKNSNMYTDSELRNGNIRLTTYNRWDCNRFSQPLELAEAGFVSLKEKDRVQCVFCGLILLNWNWYDLPIIEHWKHNPKCPFIQGYNVGNIPIIDDPVRGREPLLPCYDVCGNWDFNINQPIPLRKKTFFERVMSWFSNNQNCK